MLIAIFSDIHDEVEKLEKAIKIAISQECEKIIFCGDTCTPFTMRILSQSETPLYVIFGNADQDRWSMLQNLNESVIPPPPDQEFAELTADGKSIAYTHYPKIARQLTASQHYDAVFHGDSHVTYQKQAGRTLLANPGTISGIIKGKPGEATFMIYDTNSDSVKLITIK